ncbi:PREDICTED: transforming growth factor beta-1-induced transcript 1 protein isoform X2 [Galeopterus variegatus]|uniref:Transforming growth factor beta-1-induced transcript 1 protein isoform X2 n=1 Tax=Galeopterus variegatus TaxID=482537 RepID=A0ABM0RQZ2_GALVR|nr:PREDICTED: transforming growth factor beta-1-induced transcript 1 protein isoform X2 [Galeopterus variegatus]
MEDLDALLSDLETTTHMPRSGAPKDHPPEPVTPPPPYGHQPQTGSGESSGASGDKDHLYSTVCKPRSPKPAAPGAPPFSSSSGVLGTGLCELDRLLQELNATQFNITDEIMSQFPSSKVASGEQKEDQSEDKKRPSPPPSPSPILPKPSATSATLELDRLMASLSDFRVQNHLPAAGPTQPPVASSMSESSPSPPGPTSEGSLDTMLGLLQSDLSRRGVPTQAKGLCGSCNKPIAGQVVTALGRAWHPEHFVCGGCSTALGGSSFFEKDGAPFCPECYFERFSPRCGFCNQPIRHKMVTALGTHWHPEHFCCVSCREPFGDEGMLRALLGRQLFRARGPPAVRESFPRAARLAVRHVWPPSDRPLRICPGPPLPPGPLHLHLLPAPAHQGLFPGARGQTLLPALLP